MLTTTVETLNSRKSPWELYQTIYSQDPHSFFLDSTENSLPGHRYSYLGTDPFFYLSASAADFKAVALLAKIMSENQTRNNLPFFSGGAVGYWGYEMAMQFENIRFRKKRSAGIPDLSMGFYRDLIVYDHKDKKYYLIINHNRGDKTLKPRIERLKSFFFLLPPDLNESKFQVNDFHPELSKKKFEAMVRRAKKYIEAGDIYQANLSQRFAFKKIGSSLRLYDILRKINPSPYSSFLKSRNIELISNSPELLVRKKGDDCETWPIAGTRAVRQKLSPKKIRKDLLSNEKERAEHIMLVDLERNDLGRVCEFKSVRVSKMMDVEKYSHVMHIVSKIKGKMLKGKTALDLIRAVFPGGTVTGCPKVRCMEIIDELEPVKRGVYTGSIGYVGFNGDVNLNIVIRTLVLSGAKGYLQVGAGIVYDSDPAREYEETLHKGEALSQALAEAAL